MDHNAGPYHSSFLILPPEIRHQIYTDLFQTVSLTISPYPPRKHPDDHNTPRPEDGFRFSGTSEPVTGILSTNKLIRHECQPVFEHLVFRSLLVKTPFDPSTRLPPAFRLAEGIEMPACHDFNYIMRRRIRHISTPWLDGLQGREGAYLNRFMPNLESIEIVARGELLDMSANMFRGGLLQKFFSCVNNGSGVISSQMPLTAIRIMRSHGNLLNRVRLRVRVVFVCDQRVAGEDPADFLHSVLLECVVNPKTFDMVHYSRVCSDQATRAVNGYEIAIVPTELCRCDLNAFAKDYVANKKDP